MRLDFKFTDILIDLVTLVAGVMAALTKHMGMKYVLSNCFPKVTVFATHTGLLMPTVVVLKCSK